MATLAILRHGPTEWTAARRLQGRSDIALSNAGRDAVRRWRLPDAVIGWPWTTSPLQRCVETAAILRETHAGAEPLRVEPRLIEMSYGDWEGRTIAELRATYGQAMTERERRGLDFHAPGGESPRDLQDRLRPWLDEIAADERDTLAIAHKGVMRALYALASGWDMREKPPQRMLPDSVHLFAVDRDGLRVVDLNRSLHAAGATVEEGA